jgi:hypothetical protein
MKKGLSLLTGVLVITILVGCGGKKGKEAAGENLQGADTGKAIITFTEYDHNFGMVKEGEKVGCIFTFTNTGTSDLVIKSASTSCGCTVPKYSRKPVHPGESGTLEVVFNTSGINGYQIKSISVNSNAITPVVVLLIKAEVTYSN